MHSVKAFWKDFDRKIKLIIFSVETQKDCIFDLQ